MNKFYRFKKNSYFDGSKQVRYFLEVLAYEKV